MPAVQVSSSKATVKIDNALLVHGRGRAEGRRRSPTAAPRSTPTGVKVRFADTDTQLKAKDALQAKLGDNYIVALNLLSSSPQWLTAIGALPMYLGLDLRGGVHFLLQVDMKAALDKAADRYTTDIRSLLREKKIQYARRRPRGHQRRRSASATRPSARRARVEIEKSVPGPRAARGRRPPAASCGSSRR